MQNEINETCERPFFIGERRVKKANEALLSTENVVENY